MDRRRFEKPAKEGTRTVARLEFGGSSIRGLRVVIGRLRAYSVVVWGCLPLPLHTPQVPGLAEVARRGPSPSTNYPLGGRHVE